MAEFWSDTLTMLLYGAECFAAVIICFGGVGKERRYAVLSYVSAAVGTLALVVVFSVLSFFVSAVPFGVWSAIFGLLAMSFAAACVWAAFRPGMVRLIFCAGMAFLSRFLASKISLLAAHLFMLYDFDSRYWVIYLIRMAVFAVVYASVRWFVVSGYSGDTIKYSGRVSSVLGSLIAAVTFGLSFTDVFFESYSLAYCVVINGCEVFYAILMFCVSYAYINGERMEIDALVLKRMWKEDRKNYELQKESMELVNIRCHDIRHQLNAIKSGGAEIGSVIDGLANSVAAYDNFVNTNNKVLDVVMSNFSLRCSGAKTQFTCMVDGVSLAFMQELDIYSLFGNLLENALECEVKITPEEDRFISVTVRRSDNIVYIHEENYFTGSVQIEDGTVPTSKQDKSSHGYGMKSMKRIVEKYGGTFDAVVRDDMFQVNILIPLAGQVEKGGKNEI